VTIAAAVKEKERQERVVKAKDPRRAKIHLQALMTMMIATVQAWRAKARRAAKAKVL